MTFKVLVLVFSVLAIAKSTNECLDDNGGCSQVCIERLNGYECLCLDGYNLVDNRLCEDIDECEIPGSCSQMCTNTEGGYKCGCIDGYMLEPENNRTCKAKEGHIVILYNAQDHIRKVYVETEEYETIVDSLHYCNAMDYNFHTNTIVWSVNSAGKIMTAPIDTGSPVTTIAEDNIGTIDGIAVDWIYGNIYWTDYNQNKIEVLDKTGQIRKTLFKDNLIHPRVIAVDPINGWLYWTCMGYPAKVERAGMDGSHRVIIASNFVEWPNSLALDFVTKKIFWADALLDILNSADYDGRNRRIIMSFPAGVRHPYSIDMFEDLVYYNDWSINVIHRANKFTGEAKSKITYGIKSPTNIHIFHSYKQPVGINYCGDMNGHCSHLCLPSPNILAQSDRYSCACPDGMTLASDHKTCITDNMLNVTVSTP